ncbi:MAG: PAS domain S-box protein [Phycisphaerae bacterium]|jgi:PAS domain S-box-containing protein|nr:PAS domain S-box protein [Phycisphaerae bacterium]
MTDEPAHTILNVDDEEASLYVTSKILRQAGFEVVEARTGAEALELAGQLPDAVVLDVNLPDIDGFEVCRRLREAPQTVRIPILHLSATYKDAGAKVKALGLGADGYLTQPVEPPVLIAYIRALIRTRKAEEALRRSEEKFRLMYEQAPVGYQSLDEDGCILEVNPAWLEALGYSRREVIGRSFGDFLTPEHGDLFPERFARFKEAGLTRDAEFEMVRSDGSRRIFAIDGRIAQNEDGSFRQTHCVLRDITERKEAIEAVRKSEQEKALILNNTSDIIAYHDRNHVIQWANQAYLDATGLPLDELKGQVCYRAWGLNEICDHCPVSVAIASGEACEAELTPQNQRHWPADQGSWLVRADPVRDKDGNIIGAIEVAADIAERKQAEEELRQHREHLEELVAERTEQLEKSGAVLQAINNVFREVLMCETEEDLGKTCLAVAERLTDSKFGILLELNAAGLLDTIAISNPAWDECDIAVADAGNAINNMEIRGIDRATVRDGASRIVNSDQMATHPDRCGVPPGHPEVTAFLGVPLKHLGETIGMIGLGNKAPGYDDDDRQAVETLAVAIVEAFRSKRAEIALREVREELLRKARLAAIGQVSGSIAHDLRNPLGSVRNATYYLKQIVPSSESTIIEYLEIIDQETTAADKVITNLLKLGRTPTAVKQKVDIAQVIREALARVGPPAGIQLRVSQDPDPFEILADPDQIRQVFDNLVGNAVQAMGGEGEIIVEISRDGEGDNDTITFRDTGPGIAPDIRKTLFQPLITTKAKGTGLGLTICRQIVERHGGAIDAVDDDRAGAAFVICLPREKHQTVEDTENEL